MTEAYICDYIRTPIGRFGGSLSSVRTDDLGAVPLAAPGMIDGSVEPMARMAGAPRARIPGVEITAPPTPNRPDMMPVRTPRATVSTSRASPGSMAPV